MTKLHPIEDRHKRLNVLVDLIYSYEKHLNGERYHTRICERILFNKMLHIGKTKEKDIKTHKEHIVPCAYLYKKCFELIKGDTGQTKRETVFNILDTYLKVVIISKDKANILDHKLKLRTEMPKGWSFENGDAFARLKHSEVYGENLDEFIEWYY